MAHGGIVVRRSARKREEAFLFESCAEQRPALTALMTARDNTAVLPSASSSFVRGARRCPNLSIALLEHHDWETQSMSFYDDNGKENRQVIPMITPDGEDAAVLFKGRDSNRATNYLYGLPLDRMRGVDYVMLWALDERDPFCFPADFLNSLKGQLGSDAKVVDGRWYVNLYFEGHDKWDGCAIVPQGAPEFAENIDRFLIECPAKSMRDFGRAAP